MTLEAVKNIQTLTSLLGDVVDSSKSVGDF